MITPASHCLVTCFELRVITSFACINLLVPNFSTRNDLISVSHLTLILAKRRAAPDYLQPRVQAQLSSRIYVPIRLSSAEYPDWDHVFAHLSLVE